MTESEQEEQLALLQQYVARSKPETREEWLAQIAEWRGKVNIESLLVLGGAMGWEPEGQDEE